MKLFILYLFSIISLGLFAQIQNDISIPIGHLHYKTFGKGKPILIINGGPGMNSEGFASLAKELSKNNLAIIYDQRGTGASKIDTISVETMTMELMLEDIESLRKHLNLEKWTVLGHSFGGMLASYYTSKYPEKVTSLILSSSRVWI